MDPATRQTLREAYLLIKAGECDSARVLIKPVLASEPNNIDAWWLAAHAAVVPQDKRLALVRVLQLNPDHAPARLLLDRLNEEHPLDPKELPPPPPPKRSPNTIEIKPVRNRWVWNLIMVLGVISLLFGSLAVIANVSSIDWLDRAVNDMGESMGMGNKQGERGQLGTVSGGDPDTPYDIPVVQRQGLEPGGVVVGELNEDESHIWTFSGQHGDEVAVLLQFTVAGDASRVLELWDANNNRIAIGVGAADSGTVTLTQQLSLSGSYALVIIGRPDGPRGDYALGVELLQ